MKMKNADKHEVTDSPPMTVSVTQRYDDSVADTESSSRPVTAATDQAQRPNAESTSSSPCVATLMELRASGLDDAAVSDLRSDHAGEVGAVAIYKGILAVARDEEIKLFAHQHLATEQQHLAFFERLLPSAEQSRLLPVWRVAGFLTGALPALIGPRAVFVTIEAVESFVDEHYRLQIVVLAAFPQLAALKETLDQFRRDEVHHRQDASKHINAPIGLTGRIWRRLVGVGSSLGVALAKRL